MVAQAEADLRGADALGVLLGLELRLDLSEARLRRVSSR